MVIHTQLGSYEDIIVTRLFQGCLRNIKPRVWSQGAGF